MWRWASGEAAGEVTLKAEVADLHTNGLGLYGRFPYERSSMGNSAAELSDLADLFRITSANTIIRMRNLDSIPTACQKTEPLPYKLS